MQNDQHITMKDIAEALGISVATVSRALGNSPMISRQRREAIQQYAREHNFLVNSIAKDLRNTKRQPMRLIGVIVPELQHYFFSSVLAGIELEASTRGYRIMVAQSLEDYEREVKICQSFYENRVCGIIVSLAKQTKTYDHFISLQQKGLPLVFYDRICHGINASRVVVDDYQGAYTAVSHLAKTGCRRIAFCGSAPHMEIVKNRLNGYKDALLRHGLPIDESIIYECDNREKAEQLIPEVLRQDKRPDAFFAINDDTAVGITHVAKRMGLQVPEDVSVCGFTNGQRALACDPMLTTIDQRGTELGREAADVLIGKVEGTIPASKVEKRIVRTKLILRGTTRQLTVNN